MTKEDFDQLTSRIADGSASQNDLEQYNNWFNTFTKEEAWDINELGRPEIVKQKLLADIEAKIQQGKSGHVRPLYYRIAVASSIILLLSAGAYFISRKPFTKPETIAYKNDILI